MNLQNLNSKNLKFAKDQIYYGIPFWESVVGLRSGRGARDRSAGSSPMAGLHKNKKEERGGERRGDRGEGGEGIEGGEMEKQEGRRGREQGKKILIGTMQCNLKQIGIIISLPMEGEQKMERGRRGRRGENGGEEGRRRGGEEGRRGGGEEGRRGRRGGGEEGRRG